MPPSLRRSPRCLPSVAPGSLALVSLVEEKEGGRGGGGRRCFGLQKDLLKRRPSRLQTRRRRTGRRRREGGENLGCIARRGSRKGKRRKDGKWHRSSISVTTKEQREEEKRRNGRTKTEEEEEGEGSLTFGSGSFFSLLPPSSSRCLHFPQALGIPPSPPPLSPLKFLVCLYMPS